MNHSTTAGYTITRIENYFGRTTAVVTWKLTRDADGKCFGEYDTRRAARADAEFYAAPMPAPAKTPAEIMAEVSAAHPVTTFAAIVEHLDANVAAARYTIEREANADSTFVRYVVLDNGHGILGCSTRAAAQAHVDHLVAQAEADAADDAREAAMHREYQEGWDAFYERSGAVCPYAGGVCAKAWDEGYMAAARNARENRAMGL